MIYLSEFFLHTSTMSATGIFYGAGRSSSEGCLVTKAI